MGVPLSLSKMESVIVSSAMFDYAISFITAALPGAPRFDKMICRKSFGFGILYSMTPEAGEKNSSARRKLPGTNSETDLNGLNV